MPFAQSETQTMLADLVARLLGDLNPFEERRQRLASDNPDRLALWHAFAENGVLGAAFAEDAGGFGGTSRDLAVVMAAVGRSLAVEPVLASAVCGQALIAAGKVDEVAEIIAGKRIIVFAHSENADPYSLLETVASVEGDRILLSGQKLVVRHGDLASSMVVSALHQGEPAVFLIDEGATGIVREAVRLIDGSSAATIHFDEAEAKYLGNAHLLEKLLRLSLVGLAAETVGILHALNEATFGFLNTRQQFGAKLANFQALQHRAADMHMAAEEASALVNHALDAIDRGSQDAASAAAAAKALADRAGAVCGHEAIQLHGGMGVSDELDISHFARRLAAIRAELGQALIHELQVADAPERDEDSDPFRSEVRTFVRANLPADIAAKGALGLEMTNSDYVRWQKILREHGYFAGAWPVEYGGGGWDLEKQLIFVQEAALNNAPMIIPYGVNMVGPVIYTFGSPEQKARYLPSILANDTWWCQGYSEPNAGSDLSSLKTTAERDGDEYVVNGTKMWTTEAHWADMMHCLVRTSRDGKPQHGISFLLIDMKSPGIEIRPILTIDGQHHTNQVFLDNVRVPAENLVGEEGQGWSIAKFLLANERVSIADTGPKLRLLNIVRQLISKAQGKRDLTSLKVRLGQLDTQLRALTRLEQDYISRWSAGGSKEGPEASILKIRGTEILQSLTELALEVEGPLGAVHDPAHLHTSPGNCAGSAVEASLMAHQYLYGRCWSIFGGTNEIQRNLIARTVLG